ncbi:hypothetical protein Acr_02g0004570 [Actinidia rufa]|uniref:Uncharacterized protein n=1 Tax=Actinidia rufa TaxID=165716 RepID=A0A7J0E972_9ERIC|nr:hypothetical protein Acr_02g0004570 [Actinidia rufa]
MLDVNSILWLLTSLHWLLQCILVGRLLDKGLVLKWIVVFYKLDGDINWHDVIGLLNFFNSSVGKLVGTLSRGGKLKGARCWRKDCGSDFFDAGHVLSSEALRPLMEVVRRRSN